MFVRLVDDLPVVLCYQTTFAQTYCTPGFPVGCYVNKEGVRRGLCVLSVSMSTGVCSLPVGISVYLWVAMSQQGGCATRAVCQQCECEYRGVLLAYVGHL